MPEMPPNISRPRGPRLAVYTGIFTALSVLAALAEPPPPGPPMPPMPPMPPGAMEEELPPMPPPLPPAPPLSLPAPPDFLMEDAKPRGESPKPDGGGPPKPDSPEFKERSGRDRRSLGPERMEQFWNSLSDEERERFIANKERWMNLPPEERRELIQRHLRIVSRMDREIEQIMEQAGTTFTPERKAEFARQYMDKRRKLEHEIMKQFFEMRAKEIPALLDGMREEFPELGDKQYTDIGKRRRDKDFDGREPGAEGKGPEGPRPPGPPPGGPGGGPDFRRGPGPGPGPEGMHPSPTNSGGQEGPRELLPPKPVE